MPLVFQVWRLLHYVTDTFELLVMVLIALGREKMKFSHVEQLKPGWLNNTSGLRPGSCSHLEKQRIVE